MSIYFKNIIGHQQILERLKHDIEKNSLAHAYLFNGPADLGKFTIAKAFGKAIQTHEINEDKSLHLASLIDRGIHADTLICELNREEESIKISQIKQLINNLQMTGDSRRRILIMEDIDKMTTEAANALLKILEEPPGKVLYIFTTSNSKNILETILSRVRMVEFKLFSETDLLQSIKNRYRLADQEKIALVVELANGRIAKAIKLMESQEIFDAYKNIHDEIKDFLIKGNLAEAFTYINQIQSDKLLVQVFLDIALVILTKQMRASIKLGNTNETKNKSLLKSK
jgi:DNA polymerase-3 subunit delta'